MGTWCFLGTRFWVLRNKAEGFLVCSVKINTEFYVIYNFFTKWPPAASEGGVTTPSSLGIAAVSGYTCGPTFGNSQGKASGNLLAWKNLLARKILAAWKILPALWQ